jgi:hypothetical protein
VAEDQIRAMMAELNSKKNILSATFLESEDMHKRIVFNLEKKNGLCIRLLTKPLLQRVLGYLGGVNSSASSVCKYWYLCSK